MSYDERVALETCMDMALFENSWTRCWQRLGASGSGAALRDAVLARQQEAHRQYHNMQHLRECLQHFELVQHLALEPGDVEMALWFHDAIYDTQRHDNELMSAQWLDQSLDIAGITVARRQAMHALIMATRHSAVPTRPDECLLVDIDLSILGAPADRFMEYEDQIRREYAFVAQDVFNEKRGEILKAFLARPRIYSTTHFHDKIEARARVNLARSLDALNRPGQA